VDRSRGPRGLRIGDGEFWSARSYDPDDLIPVGASAEIEVVDGLTVLVSPVVPLTLEDDVQDHELLAVEVQGLPGCRRDAVVDGPV
jgi:hypothetical protein